MTAGRHVDDLRPADADQPGSDERSGPVDPSGRAEQSDTEQPDTEQPPPRPVDDSPVLPSRSTDDLDTGWGDRPRGDDDDRFLRDVPPHWGR